MSNMEVAVKELEVQIQLLAASVKDMMHEFSVGDIEYITDKIRDLNHSIAYEG